MKPAIVVFFLVPTPALAHLGHLGEVAGHGHWIALGAFAAAAALAAVLAKAKRAKDKSEIEDDDAEEVPA